MIIKFCPLSKIMVQYATSEDFTRWQEKAKTMSVCALEYSIRDCLESAKLNPEKEGYYMDELSCYRMELNRRQGKSLR